jgi:hypothetical protein
LSRSDSLNREGVGATLKGILFCKERARAQAGDLLAASAQKPDRSLSDDEQGTRLFASAGCHLARPQLQLLQRSLQRAQGVVAERTEKRRSG